MMLLGEAASRAAGDTALATGDLTCAARTGRPLLDLEEREDGDFRTALADDAEDKEDVLLLLLLPTLP